MYQAEVDDFELDMIGDACKPTCTYPAVWCLYINILLASFRCVKGAVISCGKRLPRGLHGATACVQLAGFSPHTRTINQLWLLFRKGLAIPVLLIGASGFQGCAFVVSVSIATRS